ncbi:hypothetical protein HanPSC8_Chr03g0090161 [Helianthus annuus]|nr:hypothetical protein HanPSC8_Chr03g0090161 [Helianthus annuus]
MSNSGDGMLRAVFFFPTGGKLCRVLCFPKLTSSFLLFLNWVGCVFEITCS